MPSGIYKRTKPPWNKDKIDVYSEETLKLKSEVMKGKNTKPLTKEHKEKISKSLKGNIPWNKGLIGCYSEEVLRKNSETTKKQWQNTKFREKMLLILLRYKNDAYGKLGKYNDIMMRSDLERMYAKLFDSFNIKWEYEVIRIIMENGKAYIPDFYLPNSKLFIEVKPKRFIHDKETRYKYNQTLIQGYNIWFAHEKNPNNTIKHILKLIERMV